MYIRITHLNNQKHFIVILILKLKKRIISLSYFGKNSENIKRLLNKFIIKTVFRVDFELD